MTTESILSGLRAAGFSDADADGRAKLAADAARGLEEASRPVTWAWFVPGRIEIFGKHTDYAGGRSLVAAVPRGFVIACSPRTDGRVRVIDARWHDVMEVDPSDSATAYRGWANYVAVVARRLAFNFPGASLGADIAVSSDLPRAAGVSSSSALVVGIATALMRCARLDQRDEFRAALSTPLDLAGYLGAVENGLTFKSLASINGVGTHGGSEDHTAILTCRANQVSAYAYVPVRRLCDEPMPDAWRFVIASSGVQADKAGSVRDRYNRASLQTRALVEIWNAGRGTAAPTLGAALSSAPHAMDELAGLVDRSSHAEYSPGDLRRRLAHFVAEDGRVPLAALAFRDANAAALGDLSRASQADAETLLGNQIAETQALAAVARDLGAIGASSFGAGFGGSVWAVTRASDAATFGKAWVEAYQKACPHVAGVEWFVTRPGPSVTELKGS